LCLLDGDLPPPPCFLLNIMIHNSPACSRKKYLKSKINTWLQPYGLPTENRCSRDNQALT
jgi:hypothetical protein